MGRTQYHLMTNLCSIATRCDLIFARQCFCRDRWICVAHRSLPYPYEKSCLGFCHLCTASQQLYIQYQQPTVKGN
jgi:hypothetical protein